MRLIDADALLKALNDYGLSYRADINGMIMQAPTIEPSGDLISRADAIEAVAKAKATDTFGRYDKQNIGIDWALDALKALPSAEAEWIPCSERLPEDGQGVLVTVDANKWNIEVGSCIYSGGTFHSKLYDLDVIAWMPLPKPYGERREP